MSTGRSELAGLYPFLYDTPEDAGARANDVLAQVQASTRAKHREALALRRAVLTEFGDELVVAAQAAARAFRGGHVLIAFGNGGSATDAQDAVTDCVAPPFSDWRPLPAVALVDDVAIVTAVANDVGFEEVYARQIEGVAHPGDIALAFSTSGNSPSIVKALAEAKRRGLLTIGMAGYDGGAMAARGDCAHCFIARGEHIPRIQEAQASVWHTLLALTQACLAGDMQ